jgi:dCTP deaminase
MPMTDHEIRKYCLVETYHRGRPMIDPFSEEQRPDGVIGYGLSVAGYDLRMGTNFRRLRDETLPIDPKAFKSSEYEDRMFTRTTVLEGPVVIRPRSFILAESLEYLRIPDKWKGYISGKSTYCRCGLIYNTSPLESGWEGHATVCLINPLDLPIHVYVGEGLAAVEFLELKYVPEKLYKGRYQAAPGAQAAKV